MEPIALEVRGKLGNFVYYMSNVSGQRVQLKRAYVVPIQPHSMAQVPWFAKFALAVSTWQALSPGEKLSYRKESMKKGRQLPGYNYYISQYMLDKI